MAQYVSIPDRGLGFFRRKIVYGAYNKANAFQSLIGV